MTELVHVPLRKPLPRAIFVAGTVGGAGATTVTTLLAQRLAHWQRRKVLVLDAAPGGGDLNARMLGAVDSAAQWDAWARTGAGVAMLDWELSGRDNGTVVLGADTPVPDAKPLLVEIIETVTPLGWTVVVDAGSGAMSSPVPAAAVQTRAALVLAIPQEVDGANRARLFLSRLAGRHGMPAINDAVVTVVDRNGAHRHVHRRVSRGMIDTVSALVRIPTDPALATGLPMQPHDLHRNTVRSVTALIAALGATDAAQRRPAG